VSFWVDNVAAMLETLHAGGTRVETQGGEPVAIDGARRVFVRDPSGILIELVQQP
jgi:catechol 2,3-dioxygenase-like lactoylglutathione lyase family enzyme